MNIKKLNRLIVDYYDYRRLKIPDLKDSAIWLSIEVAELQDALMRQEPGWVRNNPDKPSDIAGEIGDVLMMLIVTAGMANIDPVQALLDKMKSKGFVQYSPEPYQDTPVTYGLPPRPRDNQDDPNKPGVGDQW